MSTFRWRGFDLPLFDHEYNATITNERAVEIPIALDFLARGHGSVLEVGNVMSHYFTQDQLPGRVVVDKYEQHSAVTFPGTDLFALHGPFDTIVSVSTLEHVRWDELGSYRNPCGGVAAMLFLQGMVAPGGSMLATFKADYNPGLDDLLGEAYVGNSVATWLGGFVARLERVDGEWIEHATGDLAVWIVEFTA